MIDTTDPGDETIKRLLDAHKIGYRLTTFGRFEVLDQVGDGGLPQQIGL